MITICYKLFNYKVQKVFLECMEKFVDAVFHFIDKRGARKYTFEKNGHEEIWYFTTLCFITYVSFFSTLHQIPLCKRLNQCFIC